MNTIGHPIVWLVFTAFVVALLVVDLAVFHRRAHEVRVREALAWSTVWILLAAAFGIGLHAWAGPEPALEFFTGYVIEKSLSIDNLFVFLVLFSYFRVPAAQQHRVLFWGVLGALVMRAIFILAGAALLQHFHWLLYVFGGFLLLTGVKLLRARDHSIQPERSRLIHWLQRRFPTRPLLVVIIVVEACDLVFALDSVPAIFGVTEDPFIVYTSNVFAILGLRALFFVLAGAMSRFHHLKTGLALVLAFIGAKLLLTAFFHIPIAVSLAVVAALISASVVASLLWPQYSSQGVPSEPS